MNISTDTLLELKCCECECYLSRTPIYVGEDGTAICGRCPIPNNEDSRGSGEGDQVPAYYRMIPYENLIKEISFPCMYQNNGCSVKMLSKDLQNHEENCNYRPFICPLMSSGKCNWIGRKEKMIEHCESQHADRLLVHPCVIKHDYAKNILEPYLTIFFSTLFLINAKVCLTKNKIYYSVYCFGDVTNNFNKKFNLIIEREGDKIIKNGKIISFAKKMTPENEFVFCGIQSLIDILNGRDKTTFTIRIDYKNKCSICDSFYECLNENKFCEICESKKITCDKCPFKDIEEKTSMHMINFCKFTTWCWVCNKRLTCLPNQNQHYEENHKDFIRLEDNYWNISKNDFQITNDHTFIDFIIDSQYDRFFGALVHLNSNYFLKICSSTLQSEEACKINCKVSIRNNSDDDIKCFSLDYDFESKYDWNFNLPANCIFLNDSSSQIKIELLKIK